MNTTKDINIFRLYDSAGTLPPLLVILPGLLFLAVESICGRVVCGYIKKDE
jgi:hypothetical protein